jgi:nicotinamide mononucleotide transporter
MSVVEIIAVIFSLLCIWLATKRHVLNWPVGIIGVSAYLILFYQVRLYADMCLQIIFILQGFYGWYNWKRGNIDIQVSRLKRKQIVSYSILILIFSAIWTYVLIAYTNASTPYIDAFVSSISLAANWLMAKKKIENWILWIIADVIYIMLFWYKELYLSSCVYFIFLILAIKGLIDWKQKRDTKKVLL